MCGLLLYDILSVRKLLRTYGFVFLFYILLGIWAGAASTFGPFFIVFATTIPLTIFAYRERAHWDLYANVIPIARKSLVLESFIFSWILQGGALLCNVLMIVIDVLLGHNQSKAEIVFGGQILAITCFLGLIYISVFLPVLFKFGPEKGRIVMLFFYAIPVLIYMVFDEKLDLLRIIQLMEVEKFSALCIMFSILIVVSNFCSILISCRIYNKKDLD